MRTPRELPSELSQSTYTVYDSDALGVSRGILRNVRIRRISRAIRATDNLDMSNLSSSVLPDKLAPFTRVTSFSVASHRTAAEAWGFPLPVVPGEAPVLHITRPEGLAPPRRFGVIGHTGRFLPGEVTTLDGLVLTSRAKTWLDLSRYLTVEDLTVIADHLIRIPRKLYEGRSDPYATQDELDAIIGRHQGQRGIRTAREALRLSRVGADSPPETLLRLALGAAGLPEPEVNVPIVDENGVLHHEPDLGYRKYQVAVQYEGAGHSDPEQVARDISREERTRALGWTEVRISRRHMVDGARPAVEKVRAALWAAGWRAGSPE
ncbi:hypothetical protein ITX31_11710 [Arthrobacter gandavensis]|uniref:endonuclease domain-containing protein n=1 Tax=Arthrobacter gandavensis TaxID=169960 RepID=UPI00188F960F|nr:hypothetical protein [Arthrobacter gandavensis]MBF4994773.1 hypothetical protein [Arthrobacter gandavensis]